MCFALMMCCGSLLCRSFGQSLIFGLGLQKLVRYLSTLIWMSTLVICSLAGSMSFCITTICVEVGVVNMLGLVSMLINFHDRLFVYM